jgi:hypothetical protein
MGKTVYLDDKELEILKDFCDKCEYRYECREDLGGFQPEEALRCALAYLNNEIRHKTAIGWSYPLEA